MVIIGDKFKSLQYRSVATAASTFLVVGFLYGTTGPLSIFHNNNTIWWLRYCQRLGTIIGAILSAYANDVLGRKYSMLLVSVSGLLSSISQDLAGHISMVYVTFFLCGVMYAWAFSVIPIYISEIASPHLRGQFTVFCILCVPLGTYICNLIAYDTASYIISLIGKVSNLTVLALIYVMDESPYFLIMKNQDEKCKNILRKFHARQNIDKEYDDIKQMWNLKHKCSNWLEIFTVRSNLQVFLLVTAVITVQQFTGYNAMQSNIIQVIFFHFEFHFWLYHLREISLILILAGILNITAVDSCGRKPLFIIVCLGACLAHSLTGLGFLLEYNKEETSHGLGVMELIGTLIYVAMVGLGLLQLPYVLSAELFPMDIKSKACSLLIVVGAIDGFIFDKVYDALIRHNMWGPFCIMFIVALIGVIFGLLCVPETKKKSLLDIQKGFMNQG